MLKKTITFKDLDGNEVTDDFYFNLSVAELAEMALLHEGDIAKHMQAVIDSKDGRAILDAFKKIIAQAYGKRSEDGRSFLKSPEISQEFMGTEAYSQFFLDIVTSATAAVDFINGVMPADLAAKAAAVQAQQPVLEPAVPAILKPSDFTEKELLEMDKDNIYKLYAGELTNGTIVDKALDDYSVEELRNMSQERFDKLVGTDPRKMQRRHLIIAMQRKTNN